MQGLQRSGSCGTGKRFVRGKKMEIIKGNRKTAFLKEGVRSQQSATEVESGKWASSRWQGECS